MNVRKIIQNAIDYIDDNIKADISINELCGIAGYSYVHYCRLFRHYTGLAPAEYINRRKLLFSAYDMSNGLSKIDIVLSYGFETYSGFYKAFKREFNCSPSQFTKSYKGIKPHKINILQEEHIMVSKTNIQKILKYWGFEKENITNIFNKNTGRQNDNSYYVGDDYVVKFSANLGKIKNNINISTLLLKSGLPAAEVVKEINGADYLQDGELYFMVEKRIKGEPLNCEDIFSNPDFSYRIGESIAKLHQTLKCFDESNYNEVNIYSDVVNSALPKVQKMMNLDYNFTDSYIKRFGTLYNNLPKQIIHRDVNPSNMIFDNGKFIGFIDFDLTEVNLRIFDICYCATSILSECFNNPEIDNDKWIEVFKNIIKGYENVSELSDEEKQVLPYVVCSIQIICIAYLNQFDKYKDLTTINIDILKYMINEIKILDF